MQVQGQVRLWQFKEKQWANLYFHSQVAVELMGPTKPPTDTRSLGPTDGPNLWLILGFSDFTMSKKKRFSIEQNLYSQVWSALGSAARTETLMSKVKGKTWPTDCELRKRLLRLLRGTSRNQVDMEQRHLRTGQ